MKSSRPRPDLLLILTRRDEHGLAELTGHIAYRHDQAFADRGHHAEPGAVLSPRFERPGGVYDRYADLLVCGRIDTDGMTDDGTRWYWLGTDDMRRWVRHHEPPEPTPWP